MIGVAGDNAQFVVLVGCPKQFDANMALGDIEHSVQCLFLTLGAHAHEGYSTLCVCVSAVYKLLTRFILQIEHISRLYANLPRFPTYRFLSNAFFHELQHFRSFSMPSPPFCRSAGSVYYAYT